MTLDLRMPVIGMIAWASAIVMTWQPWLAFAAALVWLVMLAHTQWRRRLGVATLMGWLLICAASSMSTLLHARAATGGPLSELARDGAQVQAVVKTVSSPRSHKGQFADYTTVRVKTRWVVGRGVRHWTRAPVLIIAPESWSKVALGATVELKDGCRQPRDRIWRESFGPRAPRRSLPRRVGCTQLPKGCAQQSAGRLHRLTRCPGRFCPLWWTAMTPEWIRRRLLTSKHQG